MTTSPFLPEPFAFPQDAQSYEQLRQHLHPCLLENQGHALLLGNLHLGRSYLSALWAQPKLLTGFLFFDGGDTLDLRSQQGHWKADGKFIRQVHTGKLPMVAMEMALNELKKIKAQHGRKNMSVRMILVWRKANHILSDGLCLPKEMRLLTERELSQHLAQAIDASLNDNNFLEQLRQQLQPQSVMLSQDLTYSGDDLLQSLNAVPTLDLAEAYALLQKTLTNAVEQQLYHSRLNFGSFSAKVDYLCKQNNIAEGLFRGIQHTRDRLRHLSTYEGEELQRTLPYDTKAIALFIEHIYSIHQGGLNISWFLPKDDHYNVRPTRQRAGFTALRIIVSDWDDKYIYGRDTLGDSYRIAYQEADWERIKRILIPECQLNVIVKTYSADNNTLTPELLIFEPDYLVDVSSVASCFENYDVSPTLYLFKKFQSPTTTQAMLLGNFAGQLLDETLRQTYVDYKQSIQTFFKENALSIATCEKLDKNFHQEAQQQQANIATTLRTLQSTLAQFNQNMLVVEPSFFSEMLGLQGRMDCLQLDLSLLIEQKSGKSAFGSNDHKMIHQEKHYVQLLLYLAILHYNYQLAHHNVYMALLYSKYPNGLVHEGNAPLLLREAFHIRNEIVACEYQYTQGGLEVLKTLQPNQLNKNPQSARFFDTYILPELEKVLYPIQRADALQQAYFFRLMRFIEKEHLLAKIGNNTKENSGFASKWHDSLEEKLQAGTIYDRLTLQLDNPNGEDVQTVRLHFTETVDMGISDFRLNDIVVFYAYKNHETPDIRRTIIFRGSISELTPEYLTIRLRHPQSNPIIFKRSKEYLWAVEHDLLESSFQNLYRGLHTFLSASRDRQDLLLLQRTPEIIAPQPLSHDYGAFNDLVGRVQCAKDFFLLIGPPGTGKTSFGLVNLLKEALATPNTSVLLTAYTNRAVDEICSKLMEEQLDFIRIGSASSCESRYRSHMLSERIEQCQKKEDVLHVIRSTRIICGTTASLSSKMSLFSIKNFELAIFDEASQILEPHIIGLLSAKCNGKAAIEKFVLIGDHKQLPAVVQQSPLESTVNEPILRDIGLIDCRFSLFERLLKRYQNDANVTYMFTRQGRMHSAIADFPSKYFYQDKLNTVPLLHQELELPQSKAEQNGIEQILQTRRMTFIHAPAPTDKESDKANTIEAAMIATLVLGIYQQDPQHFDAQKTVGIIVPYRNQTAVIRKHLAKKDIPALLSISIDTVERYQGSQRDYIIYGFTVRRPEQLRFLTSQSFYEDGQIIDRKLNVALTRARLHMIMVGNTQLLRRTSIFNELIRYCAAHNGLVDVAPEKFCKGDFQLSSSSKTA